MGRLREGGAYRVRVALRHHDQAAGGDVAAVQLERLAVDDALRRGKSKEEGGWWNRQSVVVGQRESNNMPKCPLSRALFLSLARHPCPSSARKRERERERESTHVFDRAVLGRDLLVRVGVRVHLRSDSSGTWVVGIECVCSQGRRRRRRAAAATAKLTESQAHGRPAT